MSPVSDHKRVHPRVVVRHESPNYSSRGGARIELVTLHATVSHNRPGPSDIAAIGNYFGSTASEVSSHVCTDGDGHSGRFVADRFKAWHCAYYNGPSLGIEQIFAQGDSWDADEYRETARWVARWSVLHGIPIRKGEVEGGHVVRSGVVLHSQLGQLGGGHVDPGSLFDEDACLWHAVQYRHALRAGRSHL